jgi:hypothetical protein
MARHFGAAALGLFEKSWGRIPDPSISDRMGPAFTFQVAPVWSTIRHLKQKVAQPLPNILVPNAGAIRKFCSVNCLLIGKRLPATAPSHAVYCHKSAREPYAVILIKLKF